MEEFAVHGLAGARTDAIAKAAGVNIALLFYYFKSKEELYFAVLEEMFSRWNETSLTPLRSKGTPEQRILKYVEAYFDHASASIWRPRLVQQELMRSKHSPAMRKLLKKYAKPVHECVIKVLREGIANGSFRAQLDVENFFYSITGIVAQYFSNSSAIFEISGKDPLSQEAIEGRRRAVLDVITAALLTTQKRSPEGATSD
jgi:TetR/AcrR family transcriptional regulator